jgi:hypothetical protein
MTLPHTPDARLRIALQPDDQRLTSGKRQSFSQRAAEYLEARGHEAVLVDAHAPDLFARLAECDGFMWWFAHLPYPRRLGQRVAHAAEHGMGLPVFPSWKTVWHFDDKVAQHYLLEAAGVPTARTWVFWKLPEALAFLREATYPLVLKLAGGITSENVRMVRNAAEGERWAARLFGGGLTALRPTQRIGRQNARRRLSAVLHLLRTGDGPRQGNRSEVQRDYMYLQEFLPGNDGDTRVTVIGDRAFAYRRFNRRDDFRASGSGLRDADPSQISPEFVRLAFRTARALNMQSCAVDCMWKDGRPVIGEVSYYYEAWIVADCPGHWRLRGDPASGDLVWVDGPSRPEDAILADFLELVAARSSGGRANDGARRP